MIRTTERRSGEEQARAIQERRVAAGLRGHAKAVRRYGLRVHRDNYRAWIKGLPVRWEGHP